MSNSRYANYGKALYELVGEDKNLLISYQNALLEISETLNENPELLTFLSSYAVTKEKQFEVIEKLFSVYKLKHLVPFLKLLEEKRLFPKFEEIRKSFHEFANSFLNKEEGIAYSAKKLSKDELNELEKALSSKLNKEVELENRVEPSLLGGVRVFVAGKVFDGSLETKIETLRKELLHVAKGE